MKKIKLYVSIFALIATVFVVLSTTAFADDIFSTTGEVAPEKDIYYVGDTVEITDYFRNKDAATATSVSVEYYYRLDGANSVYSGSPISFGTIGGGTSKSHSYTYTFKESDIGEYRIGSKITYYVSGMGPYQEYSSGHDFIVMAAPTPTVTPTSSPTPTEEPTPEPTPVVTATPIPMQTEQPAQAEEEASSSDTANGNSSLGDLLRDKGVVTVLIIVVSVILALLITLIIIVAARKR